MSSRCAFVSLSVLLYLGAFNAYVIKHEPNFPRIRVDSVTTPCTVVKLTRKVVKPNSKEKCRVQIRFLFNPKEFIRTSVL